MERGYFTIPSPIIANGTGKCNFFLLKSEKNKGIKVKENKVKTTQINSKEKTKNLKAKSPKIINGTEGLKVKSNNSKIIISKVN